MQDTERGPRRFRVGNVEIEVVSDGVVWIDAGAVFGLVPKLLWESHTPELNDKNQIPLGLNCLLVRAGDRTTLIETGIGAKLDERGRRNYPGDYGHLLPALARAGVQPEDVDAVVNTHLHFDHCGWNTVSLHGRVLPTFPRARYYVQRGEYEVALHPNERTRGTYFGENFVPLEESGQLELVEGEYQITPEVRFLPAPGHTHDHACVAIASAGEFAIYSGDLVHHITHLERLAWISAFDVLPLISLETKRRLIEQMIERNALVIVAHAAFPGVGRVTRSDGRSTWVAS
jgi:glyoxylase-like metal-dependent hydrolase (beta-lactamase superfamily II)